MKHIEVVAAIILDNHGRVLATQRGYGRMKGYWEFPGGKIEPGETQEEALIREIREELDAIIGIDSFVTTVDWDYPEFHLTMHCHLCHLENDNISLNEHEDARWLDTEDLNSIEWLPADLQVVEFLSKRFNSGVK